MALIEKDVVLAADGKLPSDFREAFGRKAHMTVWLRTKTTTAERATRAA